MKPLIVSVICALPFVCVTYISANRNMGAVLTIVCDALKASRDQVILVVRDLCSDEGAALRSGVMMGGGGVMMGGGGFALAMGLAGTLGPIGLVGVGIAAVIAGVALTSPTENLSSTDASTSSEF